MIAKGLTDFCICHWALTMIKEIKIQSLLMMFNYNKFYRSIIQQSELQQCSEPPNSLLILIWILSLIRIQDESYKKVFVYILENKINKVHE